MGSVGLLLSLVFSTRAGLPLLLEVDLHLALLCPPLLVILELAFIITVYGVDNWARQAVFRIELETNVQILLGPSLFSILSSIIVSLILNVKALAGAFNPTRRRP